MTYIHQNSITEQNEIRRILKGKGVTISEDGQAIYTSLIPTMLPNAIYLLRHAETDATLRHAFMSDDSENSHVNCIGQQSIERLNDIFDTFHFDVIIVCSNIPRVVETGDLLKRHHPFYEYIYLNSYGGINNSGWEFRSPSMLKDQDYADYRAREIQHNMFAKSSGGSSWGDVLKNISQLIDYLNDNFASKRILLVSQGSVLQAFKILLHVYPTPWDNYDSTILFNHNKALQTNNYATIECIIDKDLR